MNWLEILLNISNYIGIILFCGTFAIIILYNDNYKRIPEELKQIPKLKLLYLTIFLTMSIILGILIIII